MAIGLYSSMNLQIEKDVMYVNWKEIEKSLEEGINTVVITTGSIEQHGLQTGFYTDCLTSYIIARKALEKGGKFILYHLMCPSFSVSHKYFPGSIDANFFTILDLHFEIVKELYRYGFRIFYFLTGHGGELPIIKVLRDFSQGKDINFDEIWEKTKYQDFRDKEHAKIILKRIQKWFKQHKDIIIDGNLYALFPKTRKTIEKYLRKIGRNIEEGYHANVVETSIVLAYFPETVFLEKLEDINFGEQRGFRDPLFKKLSPKEFKERWPHGAFGSDPTKANTEFSKEIVETAARELIEILNNLKNEFLKYQKSKVNT